MFKKEFRVTSLADLAQLADVLYRYLKPSLFLLFQGPLGAGKTTLIQMLARRLGIQQTVNSPTFLLFRRYCVRKDYYLNHFDFFRLTPSDNLEAFKEYTEANLNLIEWPEHNPQFWQDHPHIYLIFQLVILGSSEQRLIRLSTKD